MSALAYGIDLGTSNSSIMVSSTDGTLVRVNDPASGRPFVPTSVCLGPGGRLLVGTEAENGKKLRPGDYRSEFKRDIGEDTPSPIGNASYTPLDLAAKVLEFLREQAERAVPGRPRRVVLTVPVTWERARRGDILDAAVRAGFTRADVVLESEPEAAVRTAFEGLVEGPRTVLVYDLGGGTFDCAVARRAPDDTFEVLGSHGLDDIGGSDFTRAVLALLRNRFPGPMADLLDAHGDGHVDDDTLRRRIQLFDTCETIKVRLSSRRAYEELVTELTPPLELSLPREEFVKVIAPLVRLTVKSCGDMLAHADLTWADVDHVIPVGGSAKIPLVRNLLTEQWGRTVRVPDEPELAVVRGAVLYARAQLRQEEAERRAKAAAKARAEKERLERRAAAAEKKRRERQEREEREAAARKAEKEIMKKVNEGLPKAGSTSSASTAASRPASSSSSSSSSSVQPSTLVGGGCAGMFGGGVLAGIIGALFAGGDVSDGAFAFFVIAGAVVGAIVAAANS
ncbi:Hsp70 family protein [Streptomyces sp. NBC_01275]|uniref:Hsp70 family protein n=1 Tax=Streptomyces sp. NBC_01275 TaxID=2903807 RepID=UPI00224CBD87|nr:Hsp70 family protein [Streptomyces sp. NBC_01275]MCX4762009.1 Hsp70 family protein [Streptomyces sp. NBC_01275]